MVVNEVVLVPVDVLVAWVVELLVEEEWVLVVVAVGVMDDVDVTEVGAAVDAEVVVGKGQVRSPDTKPGMVCLTGSSSGCSDFRKHVLMSPR